MTWRPTSQLGLLVYETLHARRRQLIAERARWARLLRAARMVH